MSCRRPHLRRHRVPRWTSTILRWRPSRRRARRWRRSVGIDLPPAVDWILGGVLALAVLSVFGGLIWMLVKERVAQRQIEMEEAEEPPTEQETERTVRAAVDAGLAALDDADTDARRAVIACWVRLEAAAAAAGTERSAGDTSTELVSRL